MDDILRWTHKTTVAVKSTVSFMGKISKQLKLKEKLPVGIVLWSVIKDTVVPIARCSTELRWNYTFECKQIPNWNSKHKTCFQIFQKLRLKIMNVLGYMIDNWKKKNRQQVECIWAREEVVKFEPWCRLQHWWKVAEFHISSLFGEINLQAQRVNKCIRTFYIPFCKGLWNPNTWPWLWISKERK